MLKQFRESCGQKLLRMWFKMAENVQKMWLAIWSRMVLWHEISFSTAWGPGGAEESWAWSRFVVVVGRSNGWTSVYKFWTFRPQNTNAFPNFPKNPNLFNDCTWGWQLDVTQLLLQLGGWFEQCQVAMQRGRKLQIMRWWIIVITIAFRITVNNHTEDYFCKGPFQYPSTTVSLSTGS